MNDWYYLFSEGLDKKLIKQLMYKYKRVIDIFDDEFYVVFNESNIRKIEKILKNRENRYQEVLKENNINILAINDSKYPYFLKKTPNPPLFLYYKGNIDLLNSQKILGIVGTRKNTRYGQFYCENIVKGLKGYDVVTLSGLARGIDTISHKASLENNIDNIAIIGSGFNNIYPKSNIDLFNEIASKGLVITEYDPNFMATKWSFPMRNRIIAGIVNSLLVVETYKSGGSLITAELSFENNKDIYTIPAFINHESFQGNNILIKENKAKMITEVNDIITDMNLVKVGKYVKKFSNC